MGFPGLSLLHPFDGSRPRRVSQALDREFGEGKWGLLEPEGPVHDGQLTRVHHPEYLRSLQRPQVLARAFEVGPLALCPAKFLEWIALTPMRWATQCALRGARCALEQGVVVSLGGGFHHAKPSQGEGFCVLADVAYLVRTLQDEGKLRKVLHVDLDAHQGNGVSHCFAEDQSIQLFDMYNRDTYPAGDELGRSRLNVDLGLPQGVGDDQYLSTLTEHLPQFLEQEADLLIFNAGTDVLAGDALGGMLLSPKGVLDRDMFVFAEAQRRGLPILSLPSGGYSPASTKALAATAIHVLRRYGVG
jgi:histone deacetylase 11